MSKLKVMIVDDEILFREFMITRLDWNELNLDIVCAVSNGMDALNQIHRLKPDIILADINMPYMDGLQLTKRVHDLYPHIAVILITGYSEFEYAKQAIRNGAMDYILKPFEDQELINVLEKTIEKIKKNNESPTEDIFNMAKESLYLSILHKKFDESFAEQMKQLQLTFEDSYYVVCMIEVNQDPSLHLLPSLRLKSSLSSLLNNALQSHQLLCLLTEPDNKYTAIIALSDEPSQSDIITRLEKFKQDVLQYLTLTVTIGVGSYRSTYCELANSYQEASLALNQKLLYGTNKVMAYHDLTSNQTLEFYTSKLHENLLKALRQKLENAIHEQLYDLYQYIKTSRLHTDLVHTIYSGIISLGLSYASEQGITIQQLMGDENDTPMQRLKRNKTLYAIHEWTLKLYIEILNATNQQKVSKSSTIVRSIEQYILNHFHQQDLSIEQIASAHYLNADYIRSIFKKHRGTTLYEYIIDIRMQHARQLITQQTKLSVVAELCGFNDPSYFSRSFKKYFGITPSEYALKNIDL